MDAAQSITQKTPPAALEETLSGLRQLLKDNPDASDALMKKYLIPFEVVIDAKGKGEKPFLTCQYNRVGEKHRSPWTNTLHPKGDNDPPLRENDGLRFLEATFNDVWDSYKNLYYGHDSVGSVYLKDTDKGAFQGLFGIRKRSPIGSWDSVSLVHVDEPGEEECTYRVETFVRLVVKPEVGDNTTTDLSVTMSKEQTVTCKLQPDKVPINVSHIEHTGTIIEDNEMDLRSIMETVHIPKNSETLVNIQKLPQKKMGANAVMGIMMDSGMLKKRLARQGDEETTTSNNDTETEVSKPKPPQKKLPIGIPMGVNPLMAGAMNSNILKKKRASQQK
jgi:capping protein beta